MVVNYRRRIIVRKIELSQRVSVACGSVAG